MNINCFWILYYHNWYIFLGAPFSTCQMFFWTSIVDWLLYALQQGSYLKYVSTDITYILTNHNGLGANNWSVHTNAYKLMLDTMFFLPYWNFLRNCISVYLPVNVALYMGVIQVLRPNYVRPHLNQWHHLTIFWILTIISATRKFSLKKRTKS